MKIFNVFGTFLDPDIQRASPRVVGYLHDGGGL